MGMGGREDLRHEAHGDSTFVTWRSTLEQTLHLQVRPSVSGTN